MLFAPCLVVAATARGDPDMDALLKVGKSARKAGEIYAHARFRGEQAATQDVLLVFAVLFRARLFFGL
jgi:hypothetical protein